MERRVFEVDVGSVRAETRTVEASLSSEFPVLRREGEEVLSHKPGAIDLSRAPLPLLRSHNVNELPVGIVESLKVEGGKLRGIIRFSESADAIWQDVKDGIVRNLSVGYQIIEKVKTKRGFMATKWQIYEVSLVAAPADSTVGINRSINNNKERKIMDKNDILKERKAAMAELTELAKSGEDMERLAAVKLEIRSFDERLEALEMTSKKTDGGFVPDMKKVDRSLIEVSGGPASNRTFAGMFNGGKPLEVNEDEIRGFRAAMIEGVPSSGGFSVPEPLSAIWLDAAMESEIIRPRAQVWPMSSATMKVPGWDAANRTGGTLFNGFKMEFLTEEGEGTPQVGKLRLVELKAKKGALFCDISSELAEDGVGIDAQIDQALRKSLSYGIDNALINGAGGAAPTGILNDVAKITVAAEGGQLADTFTYLNAVKMFQRMYPAGRSKAVWLANDSVIPQLLQMSLEVGDGGSQVQVFSESNGTFRLLGRPIVFSSHFPELGAEGDIAFTDLSQFMVGIRRDVRLEKSMIPGWQKDLSSYRVLVRFDGMGSWNAPITPEHGLTQSWIVTLAAR